MKMQRNYGGADVERIFLYPATIEMEGKSVEVMKSSFPDLPSMDDVFLRHIGRYGIALPYIRPDYTVLDFPCGSGLALEILGPLGTFGQFRYKGIDIDPVSVQYAKKVYGSQYSWAQHTEGDLTAPALDENTCNTIMCIEGLEHIGPDAQERLIRSFYQALIPGGTLVISSPAPESGITGPNPDNPYHLCELTRDDFQKLLTMAFGRQVEIVSQDNLMTTGKRQLCHYAVCHRPI